MRVEFVGGHFSPFHNNHLVAEGNDKQYANGLFGLRVNKTHAEFREVDIRYSRRCFVIMPFAARFVPVFEAIKATVESHAFTCVRADTQLTSKSIIDNVENEIAKADLIIADLTDKKPNVYCEFGLADAQKKPWILLAQ